MKRVIFKIGAVVCTLMILIGAFAACSSSGSAPTNTSYNKGYASEAYSDEAKKNGVNGEEATMDFDLATDENAKIVWTGSVSMESKDWAKTVQGLKDLFATYNVQVMSSEESGGVRYESSGYTRTSARYATFVLRVPSEHFNDLMSGFSDVEGAVTGSSKSRADMTKRYNENELSLELLNEEYDDLKKLMSQAKDLSEIMLIRDRMTEVMKEIRSLSDANNQIDYDVQYSRVTLTLREVIVYSDPTEEESWFTRFGEAFVDGIAEFGRFIGNFFIWLGGNLFFLILIGVVFVLVPLLIIRGCIRKARKKKAAAQAKEAVVTVEEKKE